MDGIRTGMAPKTTPTRRAAKGSILGVKKEKRRGRKVLYTRRARQGTHAKSL